MAEYRAADLPEGSVVAHSWRAWIKGSSAWKATMAGSELDDVVDKALAEGAVVLRVGTGEEG